MKMRGIEVYEATETLAGIINTPRNIPQTAKYRISRMHAALEPEYRRLYGEKTTLIREFGEEVFADEAKTQPTGWGIPDNPEARAVYLAAWNAILAVECEIDVQPMTLASLGNDPQGIEAAEFGRLVKLIVE